MFMVNVTLGIPGIFMISGDPANVFRQLSGRSHPVAIVKRGAQGLSFDTGLTDYSGAPLTVWSLHCENHQLWYLDRRGRGTVSLRSVATGLVVSGRSVLTEGTGLTMDEWASKPWQTWRIRPTSTKRGFAILSADDSFRSDPLAVDVTDNAGLGSFVQVQRWRDVPSQHFLLLRVREP